MRNFYKYLFTFTFLYLAFTARAQYQGGNGKGNTTYELAYNLPSGSPANSNMHLNFYVQPSTDILTYNTFSVTVEVLDNGNNRDVNARNSISLDMSANPGGATLSGTKRLNVSSGVVTFSGLTLDQTGSGYSFSASSNGITSATSSSFMLYKMFTGGNAAGDANEYQAYLKPSGDPANSNRHLNFHVNPATDVLTHNTFSVTVEILDNSNNRDLNARNSINLGMITNPGNATLSGTTKQNATAGVITFSDLSLNQTGSGYTVGATANGISADTTSSFMLYKMFTGGDNAGDLSALKSSSLLSNTWLTSGTSSFTTAGNWSGGVFPASETATIPSGGTQPVISSGTATISSGTTINIKSGASLTVNAGTTLVVNGTVNNSGTLTFKSDATATASLGSSSGSITGNITTERYIPAVTRRYRMLAPHISNFTYDQLIDDIFVTGPSGGVGFDATPGFTSNPSIYTYQESTGGAGRGWQAVSNTANSLSSGFGALVFVRGDRTLSAPQWYTSGQFPAQNAVTLDYTGTAAMGNISPTITYTNTGFPSSDGYNLIGNPYPSAIDWSLVTRNNISAFYYMYNPASGSYEADNYIIASGQGFMIQATGTSPSITFTEACKTADPATEYFKSAGAPFTIRLIKDSLNSDKAIIKFGPQFNKGYNNSEDANKLGNSVVNLSLYADTQAVQINGYPLLTAVSDTFPISIQATAGTYQFQFSNLSHIPAGKSVLLNDKYTSSSTLITNQSLLPVSITSNPLSAGKRFDLIILNTSALPVEWLSFSGSVKQQDALLQWATTSEKNNSHFVVQRKKETETDFVDLVQVPASKNNTNNYNFTDEGIFSATTMAYYRIKQIDFSGETAFSETITLHADKNRTPLSVISVFPNPARLSTTVSADEQINSIRLFDCNGKLVFEKNNINNNKTDIDLTNIKAGIYLLRMNNREGIKMIVE